jgi:SAM-dependent methyltransferase
MLLATDHARLLLADRIGPGALAVDATVGNGHDTLWLAERVGPHGRVFGFDIQAHALSAAADRVAGLRQVALVHAGHDNMRAHLPTTAEGRVAAVMFNLGYLPGADKTVRTRVETTLAALQQALEVLTVGGMVTLVLYPGHEGGADEAEAVRGHAARLAGRYSATLAGRLNASGAAPQLLAIERLA